MGRSAILLQFLRGSSAPIGSSNAGQARQSTALSNDPGAFPLRSTGQRISPRAVITTRSKTPNSSKRRKDNTAKPQKRVSQNRSRSQLGKVAHHRTRRTSLQCERVSLYRV